MKTSNNKIIFSLYKYFMKLEFPEKKHEKEYLEMIQEFTDNKEVIIPWAANLKEGETYDDFLVRIKRDMETGNPKYDFAKSSLYYLIDDKEKIVWIEAIRPILSEALRYDGGNIGYGIRPSERRKGYATIWLTLALQKCKDLWLEKALLTCGKNNIWSSKTMIKNWWIRDSEYENKWIIQERYRIPIK